MNDFVDVHQSPRTHLSGTLSGTFIVPFESVLRTGNLLPLMALMLRAAGMEVLVLGSTLDLEKRAAAYNIPFTHCEATLSSGKNFQTWKHEKAKRALDHGPVLWPDIDFATWAGPDLNNIPGLTIVNIGALLATGMKGSQRGQPV